MVASGFSMRPRLLATLLAAAALIASPSARAEHAFSIDRVVAFVGDYPILRSEVAAKARLLQPASGKPLSAADVLKTEKAVLEAMIDNALILQDAVRLKLHVSELEVMQGKQRLAQRAGRSHEQILALGRERGFTVDDYDAAVRGEILEEKWISLVVKPRVKAAPSPEGAFDPNGPYVRELIAERARAVAELRKSIFVQVRW